VDWVFNPANTAIVRCGQVQPSRGGGCHKVEADKLSLYVELNVSFKLSAEDAKAVPQSEYMVGHGAGDGAGDSDGAGAGGTAVWLQGVCR
jgi:hypothetical protein